MGSCAFYNNKNYFNFMCLHLYSNINTFNCVEQTPGTVEDDSFSKSRQLTSRVLLTHHTELLPVLSYRINGLNGGGADYWGLGWIFNWMNDYPVVDCVVVRQLTSLLSGISHMELSHL